MRPTVMTALLLLACFLAPAVRAANPPLKPDAPLDAVLDALDARGRDLKDFSADVVIHTVDDRTGEDSAQIGTVIFQNRGEGDSRIKVGFDTKRVETAEGKQTTQKQRLDYLLDAGWLTDRDYQKKLEVRRQVLKPGQKMNLLKLGEGPFPLPIGQPKDEVKKQFEAIKMEVTKDDPKETAHIRLVPKKGTAFAKRFKQIDVYVDVNNDMPARIDTTDNAGTTRTTELTNVKLNAGATDEMFKLPPIDDQGWNRREEPFE